MPSHSSESLASTAMLLPPQHSLRRAPAPMPQRKGLLPLQHHVALRPSASEQEFPQSIRLASLLVYQAADDMGHMELCINSVRFLKGSPLVHSIAPSNTMETGQV